MQASFAAQSLQKLQQPHNGGASAVPVFVYNLAEYYGFFSSTDLSARNAIINRVSSEHLNW